MLDKLKIDDVVGAIPVHGFAGIWGTLAVVLTGGYHGEAALGTQILGMVAIIGTTFVLSLIVWFILKAVMGIRVFRRSGTRRPRRGRAGHGSLPGLHQGLDTLAPRAAILPSGPGMTNERGVPRLGANLFHKVPTDNRCQKGRRWMGALRLHSQL
jgi:hypothetical protein